MYIFLQYGWYELATFAKSDEMRTIPESFGN